MATALLSFEQPSLNPRLARSIWFLGGLMTVHADASDTNGNVALIEVTGRPGGEPPRHVHQNEDEMFYVMEGKLKVFRGEEEIILKPGNSAFLPRGVSHTFKILSNSARWLVYVTPAGFEEYFRKLGRPAERLTPPDVVTPPDLEKFAHVAKEFGVTFVA
jgi:quercetin dioxygenase-like cupin family protein